MRALNSIRRYFGKDYGAFALACLSCVSLVFGVSIPRGAWADGQSSCTEGQQNMIDTCITGPQGTTLDPSITSALAQPGGMTEVSSRLSAMTSANAEVNANIADQCHRAGTACKEACDQEAQEYRAQQNIQIAQQLEQDGEKCKEVASNLATEYASQAGSDLGNSQQGADAADRSAATGQGGGNGDMLMGGLLGAGLALGAMCLMGSICEDDEEEAEDGSETVTEGDEEDVDCTAEGAHSNPDCVDDNLAKCEADPMAEGCKDFSDEYCSIGPEDETSPTSVDGMGVGTKYCQLAIAKNFCSPSGRESCPTCQGLERMQSPACENNPSLCLPQMTNEDKEMAQVVCPTDPIFSNPQFMAGSDAGGTDNDTIDDGIPEGTGPAVMSGSTTAASYGSGTYGAAVGANATGAGRPGSAGTGSSYQGTSPQALGGSAVGSGSAYSGTRSIASAQVNSEIAPALGPGLFARHSRVIAGKCQAGEVNNCGPRTFTQGLNSGSATSN